VTLLPHPKAMPLMKETTPTAGELGGAKMLSDADWMEDAESCGYSGWTVQLAM